MDLTPLPDLVADSKFETVVLGDSFCHKFRQRDTSGQIIDVFETWTRKELLGHGAYGTVWLEECQKPALENGPHVRAVKVIPKGSRAFAGYDRELLAIAKFSHAKARRYQPTNVLFQAPDLTNRVHTSMSRFSFSLMGGLTRPRQFISPWSTIRMAT